MVGLKLGTEVLPDGTRVVSVLGELDLSTAPEFERELDSALDLEPRGGGVVVDLTSCLFMDSTALGVLIAARKRCGDSEDRLSVVAADRNVLKVFEVTGLDRMFAIHASRDAALSQEAAA